MFECIKNWFKGPDINDCNIEVKIKYVDGKYQSPQYRHTICSYKVVAYWRIEGMWWWRSIGVIHSTGYGGYIPDIKEHRVEDYLKLARKSVKQHLNGEKHNLKKLHCKFHVSELANVESNQLINPPRGGSRVRRKR